MYDQRPFSPYFKIIDRTQTGVGLDNMVISYCEDCACAAVEQIFAQPFVQGREVVKISCRTVPELRFEPLVEGEYWAVFNPTGETGVVVLNQNAVELLTRFNEAKSLAEIRQSYAGFNNEVKEATSRLLALGLILPVGETQSPALVKSHLLTIWLHLTNQCNLDCSYCYLEKTNEHMSETVGEAGIDAAIRFEFTLQNQARPATIETEAIDLRPSRRTP